MGRPGYPAEFRRNALDLLTEGRSVASVTYDLDISDQMPYNWRRQDRVDRGEAPSLTSTEKAELTAANKRIAQLETEPVRRAGPGAAARWSVATFPFGEPAHEQRRLE